MSGAGGFLGRYVVERLLARQHDARAILRPGSPHPEWNREVEVIRADLAHHDDLLPAFDGIDAVIHLAVARGSNDDRWTSATMLATERFFAAMARSTTKRLLHLSSLVVYDWSKAHGVLDERTPLLEEPGGMGGYTVAKVAQEHLAQRYAQAHGWELTILRPGFIWGPQHAEIGGMGRRFGPVHVMFGANAWLALCHVVNCADCLVRALENPIAVGESFNVIDYEVRVRHYVGEYARRTGRRTMRLPLPYSLGHGLARLATLASRTLRGPNARLPSLLTPRRFEAQFKPLRFPNRKLRHTLDWDPPLTFDECLKATYARE